MSNATLNLTVPRGQKSVWDAPSLSATISNYDRHRWLAVASGCTMIMLGARRGGVAGGLLATLGSTIAIRAAMGRQDFKVLRDWIDHGLRERGWIAKDVVEDASADSFPASDAPGWTVDSGATISR